MIANVGPCHMQYEDTHNTLKYANRAKNIKTKIVRNVLSVAHHISKYTQIIQDLRAEVTTLKTRLADNDETTVPSRGMDPKGELQVSREVGTVLKFVIEDYEFCRIFRRIVDLLLMNR